MKKKTIYLHVGLSKTGTTSIQSFLFKNRGLLAKKGVLYPIINHDDNENGRNENLRPIWHNGCGVKLGIDSRMFTKNKLLYAKKIYRERLEKEYFEKINSSNCNTVILSDEVFSEPDRLKHSLALLIDILNELSYQVKVVVYIRPCVDWICSMWSQRNKHCDCYTYINLKDCMNHENFKETFNLIPLVKKLGKDNVIIRPFEKAQWKNGNLIEDFLDIFDIELTDEFVVEKSNKNVSIGRNFTEISRLMSIGFDNYKEVIKQIKAVAPKEPSIPSTLTDEEILEITNEYKPILTKLANIYGKESFFINEFPSCYGKEREPYNNITITPEQFDILIKAACNDYKLRTSKKMIIYRFCGIFGKPIIELFKKIGINIKFKRPKSLR